jgi:hypothetical protein
MNDPLAQTILVEWIFRTRSGGQPRHVSQPIGKVGFDLGVKPLLLLDGETKKKSNEPRRSRTVFEYSATTALSTPLNTR